jgi:hypothetical protein
VRVGSAARSNSSLLNKTKTAGPQSAKNADRLCFGLRLRSFAQDDNGRMGQLIKMVVAVVLGDLDFYVEEVGEVSGG